MLGYLTSEGQATYHRGVAYLWYDLIIGGSFPFEILVAFIHRGLFPEFYSTPLANPGQTLGST